MIGSLGMASHSDNHYFVPHGSIYPALISAGLLSMASGFVFNVTGSDTRLDGSLKNPAMTYLATPGKYMMYFGLAVILFMMFKWLSDVVVEGLTGKYKQWEDKSFRIGMIVFICSEVAFFSAFFGALFYMRVLSVPDLASYAPDITPYKDFLSTWPSQGPGGVVLGETYKPNSAFHPMSWQGLPLINTLLLLTSGVTITWAHWGLIKNNRKQLVLGLFLTVALGVIFLCCQATEYHLPTPKWD
jgi:cytochrome c oxidase subunit III